MKGFNKVTDGLSSLTGIDMEKAIKEPGKMTYTEEKAIKTELSKKRNFMRNNADIYAEETTEFHYCPRYKPCPICNKCKNKNSGLYLECEECRIPICGHTPHQMAKMIRRENFRMGIDGPLKTILKEE